MLLYEGHDIRGLICVSYSCIHIPVSGLLRQPDYEDTVKREAEVKVEGQSNTKLGICVMLIVICGMKYLFR